MSFVKDHIKTIVKLDLLALGTLDLSNRVIFSLSGGKNMLKPGGGKYYKWKYGDVFYYKYGEGDPIVLLHDLNPEFSSYEWSEVTDQMSKTNTIYIVDLPGCGRSQKPHIIYTNYFYTLFLKSFIKEVVKQKCEIIASGYSSSFAIAASADSSSMIKRITAVNPHSIKELSKQADYKDRAARILLRMPIIGTSVYNINESRPNIDYRFTEEYMYNPFKSKARYTDAFYEGAHYNNGGGKFLLASMAGRKLNIDLKKTLAQTQAQIIIITGDKSQNAEPIARQYRNINSSVKYSEIHGCKRLPHMENPELFTEVFIKSHS